MVSIYTYFNLGARNGVHFNFTHISNLAPGMGSIYTYFNFGAGNGVHLHIFQIWGPEMVSIYTYFKFGPRCGLNNPINRRPRLGYWARPRLLGLVWVTRPGMGY